VPTQTVPCNTATEKVWLDLPYKQKEAAKHAAGNLPDEKCAIDWDKQEKRWYARPGADLDKIKQWLPGPEAMATNVATEKTWLAVAFEQREAVKAIAGKLPNGDKAVDWDKAAKCRYANPGADLDKLKPWTATEAASRQRPALSPEEEFGETLRSMGCVVSGDHPAMDGKKHRIEIEGDKKDEKAGFYVGWLDGHPAGYIKNNRTGIELKWKSKGYSLDPEQKAVKLAARAEEQQREQERAAQRAGRQMADLVPVVAPTPYLEAKGITPQAGVYTDRDDQKTYIPAIDADGKQWTIQYI
jgi:putative DNA primase/helicase